MYGNTVITEKGKEKEGRGNLHHNKWNSRVQTSDLFDFCLVILLDTYHKTEM